MERITMCYGTVADGGCPVVRLNVEDNANDFYYTTVTQVFSDADTLGAAKAKEEPLHTRFVRYLEDAHRDGVMGDARYAVAISKMRKLHRFLTIVGLSSITAGDFTSDLVLEFRKFVYDEYQYVPLYPELYPRQSGHRPPSKRCCNSTVVHDLKLLQAFFAELENTGEIRHSPFRKISLAKRRAIMHVMYDDPVFLRAEELKRDGHPSAAGFAVGQRHLCAQLRHRLPNWRLAASDARQGGHFGRRHPLRPLHPIEDRGHPNHQQGDSDPTDCARHGNHQPHPLKTARRQAQLWQATLQQNPAQASEVLRHHPNGKHL